MAIPKPKISKSNKSSHTVTSVDEILARIRQGRPGDASSSTGSVINSMQSRKEAIEGYRPSRGANSSKAEDGESSSDSNVAPAGRGGSTRYSRVSVLFCQLKLILI
jgi:hypothetical protein